MSGPPAPLRAVFFDVGETLVRPRRPHADLLTDTCREQGVALDGSARAAFGDHIAARVAARAREGRPFTFPPEESRRFWLETYRDFLRRYLPAEVAGRVALAYRALLSAPGGYALYDDALPALAQLRARGLALGVISNWEAWLPALLDEAGLTPYFGQVVISGLRGVEKPDPRLFVLALTEGGYRPEEIAYVGDSPAHDVAPALALGIAPILLDRDDRYPTTLAPRRIGSLRELPTALDPASPAAEPSRRSGVQDAASRTDNGPCARRPGDGS